MNVSQGKVACVFCCARQASKCSQFLLTTVTCTHLENIFLPSSFCSQAFAFLFYLHYKTGFRPSPKSDVTEMKSKEMPDCWWGLWLTGTSLVCAETKGQHRSPHFSDGIGRFQGTYLCLVKHFADLPAGKM